MIEGLAHPAGRLLVWGGLGHGARLMRVWVSGLIAVVLVLGAPVGAQARSCPKFTVGQANSTAYPDGKLPARGSTVGASCATLRSMARKLYNDFRIPRDAQGIYPEYGRPFRVSLRGRSWSCRWMIIGGSGPSWRFKCARKQARLRWQTG